jgi:branched-chain amino acid transport system permease protein
LQLLQPLLENVVRLDPGQAFLIQLLIYGIGLVILVRVRPQGLLPEGFSLTRLLHRSERRRSIPATAVAMPATAATSPRPETVTTPDAKILEVRHLSKRFGGILACRDLSLELKAGRIAALVGPNGAGKTTVFNLLTGALRADAGEVLLRGENIRGLSPDDIARKGMVRSFQNVRLFGRMSALDNVMLGVRHTVGDWRHWPSGTRGGENLGDLFLAPAVAVHTEKAARERAMEWLRLVGMGDAADVPAGALSYGQQKMTSFARLLATDAEVLLLDEPTSGVDARWVDSVLDLVVRMRDLGKTVCIVEHSVHVVEKLADTVFFMELGHITAEGKIAELTSDRRLAEVYFGTV